MKNDAHPLIRALEGKQKMKGPTELPQLNEPAPRTLEIKHEEIPGLPGRHIGEPITVSLQGHIHSQHNDGHAVIHIASVKPDGSAMEKKQYPEQKVPERGVDQIRVRTQQSHA